MYKDTVTLFNRRREGKSDVFYPTILRGVDLNDDKAAVMAQYGAQSTDRAILHVKCRKENGVLMAGGKRYLRPKEWQKDGDPAGSITFTAGQRFDFFWEGEWTGDSLIRDDDYKNGFYEHMNTNYDSVFAVTAAARYSVIPHLEVTGK